MKRLVCLTAILMSCCLSSAAQSATRKKYPKFEFFAGYSRELINNTNCGAASMAGFSQCLAGVNELVRSNADFFKPVTPMNGFELSATYNFNSYLGVKGDFSAHFKKELVIAQDSSGTSASVVDTRLYQYMLGPELKLRNDSVIAPFGYALIGGAHSTVNTSTIGNSRYFPAGSYSTDNDARTSAVGGGVDLRVSERTSVRYSVDFNPTRARVFRPAGQTQNNFRTSIGILFH